MLRHAHGAAFRALPHDPGRVPSRGFRDYPIEPVAQPVDTEIDHVAHDDLWPDLPLPGVRVAASFIPSDHAERRRTKIRLQMWLRGLLVDLAPKDTAPVPSDEHAFLEAVYPTAFDRAGVRRPALPPELRDGPTGRRTCSRTGGSRSLRLVPPAPDPGEVAAGEAAEDEYVVDLSHYLDLPAKPGLLRPGGKAVFTASESGLTTRTVIRDDDVAPDLARRAMVAGLTEDMTNFRHNLGTHNVALTDVAIATINRLPAHHPVRRVLQHTFHTLLIGNLENCNAHFAGAKSFSVTLFSHGPAEVAALAARHLREFDLLDLSPDLQFERRGTTSHAVPLPLPRQRDGAVGGEPRLRPRLSRRLLRGRRGPSRRPRRGAWADELDRLLPNPPERPDGLTREWVARVCATVIHLSTVEHDILNNVTWDYTTFGFVVPCVVPASGEHMDRLRALDMIAVLFVTWRPFNMLFESHIEDLAPDAAGRDVMLAWLDRLRGIQAAMEARGHDPSLAYPATSTSASPTDPLRRVNGR